MRKLICLIIVVGFLAMSGNAFSYTHDEILDIYNYNLKISRGTKQCLKNVCETLVGDNQNNLSACYARQKRSYKRYLMLSKKLEGSRDLTDQVKYEFITTSPLRQSNIKKSDKSSCSINWTAVMNTIDYQLVLMDTPLDSPLGLHITNRNINMLITSDARQGGSPSKAKKRYAQAYHKFAQYYTKYEKVVKKRPVKFDDKEKFKKLYGMKWLWFIGSITDLDGALYLNKIIPKEKPEKKIVVKPEKKIEVRGKRLEPPKEITVGKFLTLAPDMKDIVVGISYTPLLKSHVTISLSDPGELIKVNTVNNDLDNNIYEKFGQILCIYDNYIFYYDPEKKIIQKVSIEPPKIINTMDIKFPVVDATYDPRKKCLWVVSGTKDWALFKVDMRNREIKRFLLSSPKLVQPGEKHDLTGISMVGKYLYILIDNSISVYNPSRFINSKYYGSGHTGYHYRLKNRKLLKFLTWDSENKCFWTTDGKYKHVIRVDVKY